MDGDIHSVKSAKNVHSSSNCLSFHIQLESKNTNRCFVLFRHIKLSLNHVKSHQSDGKSWMREIHAIAQKNHERTGCAVGSYISDFWTYSYHKTGGKQLHEVTRSHKVCCLCTHTAYEILANRSAWIPAHPTSAMVSHRYWLSLSSPFLKITSWSHFLPWDNEAWSSQTHSSPRLNPFQMCSWLPVPIVPMVQRNLGVSWQSMNKWGRFEQTWESAHIQLQRPTHQEKIQAFTSIKGNSPPPEGKFQNSGDSSTVVTVVSCLNTKQLTVTYTHCQAWLRISFWLSS